MAEKPATIHVVPYFSYRASEHGDWRTNTRRALALVGQYLQACREDEGYHAVLSQVSYLRPFFAARSDEREFLRGLIAAGRIEACGCYNQPNGLLIQGEPYLRNVLYGRLFHEQLLGATPIAYLQVAPVSHFPQLPQIAARAGFELVLAARGLPGVPPLCYMMAPDGSALLWKAMSYPFAPGDLEALVSAVPQGLSEQAALGLDQDLALLGAPMSPPAPWLAGSIEALAERDPSIAVSTPQRYLMLAKPEAQLRRASIPLLGRDCSWYEMGSPVSRPELKIANRLAENACLSAERWATLAGLLGARYPDHAMDRAWRLLLAGQDQGAISGAADDIPFLDLMAGHREALDLATEVDEKARGFIAHGVDTKGVRGVRRDGASLVVFNPLGWPRTDVCRARVRLEGPLVNGFTIADDRGAQVTCQLTRSYREGEERWAEVVFIAAEVPSVGYRTYSLRPARTMPRTAEASGKAEGAIENERFSVKADPARGGALASIFDKALARELIDHGLGLGNEVLALTETPGEKLSSRELHTTGEVHRSGDRPAKVTVLRGPVFTRLRVEGGLPDRCELAQEITLYRGLDRIELRTTVEGYRGSHELLGLAFPFDLQGGVPTYEGPFGAVARKPGSSTLDFRTHEGESISGSGLGIAQNWVGVGPAPSLSIVSGGRTVGSVPLGPCAIVTSGDLKERAALRTLEAALLSRGITCTSWLDTEQVEADTGACAFRMSLGLGNTYSKRALEDHSEAAAALARTLPQAEWAGVLISRPDPAGEWPPVPVLIVDTEHPRGLPWVAEQLAAEISEDALKLPASNDFSGLARELPECGVALINRGSPAVSLESDGTLLSLLLRTCAWGGRSWGEGQLARFLVPEHKSHVFEHALISHRGDWREGAVVRAAQEVNHPLRAVQAPVQSGPLPARLGLVEVDAPNVVITAVKPRGNPLAEHTTAKRSLSDGEVLVRMYETEGRGADARVTFGAKPEAAVFTNLMEREIRQVELNQGRWRAPQAMEVSLRPNEIVTAAVKLAPPATIDGGEELFPPPAGGPPVHCRYWDHNLGAAPMGNQPVTLWMQGQLPLGKNTRFSLGLSNDACDLDIAGTVQVSAPSEWTLIPKQVPYRIAAGSQAVYEIMVIVPAEAAPTFVRASTECEGQLLQDVLPVGEVQELKASLRREQETFVLSLANPNADYVEGEAALITPLESWGAPVGEFARASVDPRAYAFRLDPGEEKQFRFALTGDREGLWAVAKVAWYGRVQYLQE